MLSHPRLWPAQIYYFAVFDPDAEPDPPEQQVEGNPSGWLAVIALWAYVAAFCLGVGALPWLIATEISPLALRSKITGAKSTTYMMKPSKLFRMRWMTLDRMMGCGVCLV